MLALSIVMLEVGFPQRAVSQWRAEVLPGVRFGPPLRAGFAIGVVLGNRTPFAQFAGPMVVAEIGVGGTRASAGYMLAFPFASGAQVLGSIVRTWEASSQAPPNRTLVGGELRVTVLSVNLGLGVFRPVRSAGDDRRTRYYMNVGLGI